VVGADPGQSLTALIIVTSALSVFGQYIDTVHRQEMADMRKDLESLGLNNIEGTVPKPLSDVKKRWDQALSGMQKCERAIKPIIFLFLLLIISVALEMVFALSRPSSLSDLAPIHDSILIQQESWRKHK